MASVAGLGRLDPWRYVASARLSYARWTHALHALSLLLANRLCLEALSQDVCHEPCVLNRASQAVCLEATA